MVVSFLLVSILFLTWFFGKYDGFEIRTTLKDWFPFLYFVYLLINLINKGTIFNNFDSYQWSFFIIFLFFIVKDCLNGIRFFLIINSMTSKIVDFYDKIKKYLFRDKIDDTSELLLIVFLCLIQVLQKIQIENILGIQTYIKVSIIQLQNKSNLELFGFIVTLLSVYGIYIGFLQYLTSVVEGDIYLGRSKVDYLIRKSIWYHFTQTKVFKFLLFVMIFVPIIAKSIRNSSNNLATLWQSAFIILLIIYMYLLFMSLYIIKVVLLMKTNTDIGLKSNIRKNIQQEYTDSFWIIYHGRRNLVTDFIRSYLSNDFIRIKDFEKKEFISNIFEKNNFTDYNLYNTINRKVQSDYKLSHIQHIMNLIDTSRPWLKTVEERNHDDITKEWYDFYFYYKKYVTDKWKFLLQIEDKNINNFDFYNTLLSDDVLIYWRKKLI